MTKKVNLLFEAIDPFITEKSRYLRKKTYLYVSRKDFPESEYPDPTASNLDCKFKVDGKEKTVSIIISKHVPKGKMMGSFKLIETLCGESTKIGKFPDSVLVGLKHDVEVFYSPLELRLKYKTIDLDPKSFSKYGEDLNCVYVSSKDVDTRIYKNPDKLVAFFKIDGITAKAKVIVSDKVEKGEVRGIRALAEGIYATNNDYTLKNKFINKFHDVEIREVDIKNTPKIKKIEVSVGLSSERYKYGTYFNVIDKKKDKVTVLTRKEKEDDDGVNKIELDADDLRKKITKAINGLPVENGTKFVISVDKSPFTNINDKKIFFDCEVVNGYIDKHKPGEVYTIDDKTTIEPELADDKASIFYKIKPKDTVSDDKPLAKQIKFDWSDEGLGGMKSAIEKIMHGMLIMLMYSNKELKKMNLKFPRGMLLFGPPGNGKTLIFKTMSKIVNKALESSGSKRRVEFINVGGPELESKWLGGSAKNVRNLFKAAKEDYKKNGEASKLYFYNLDEMDSFLKKRENKQHIGGVTQFLSELDGTDTPPNIFVSIATNLPGLLDSALLRPGRIEFLINISRPNLETREAVLKVHFEKVKDLLDKDISVKELAKQTKGFSCAELKKLVDSSVRNSLMEGIHKDEKNKLYIRKDSNELITVKPKHIKEALIEMSEQYNSDNLRYYNFTKEPFVWYSKNLKEKLQKSAL